MIISSRALNPETTTHLKVCSELLDGMLPRREPLDKHIRGLRLLRIDVPPNQGRVAGQARELARRRPR